MATYAQLDDGMQYDASPSTSEEDLTALRRKLNGGQDREQATVREYLQHVEEELEALHRVLEGFTEALDPFLKPVGPEKSLMNESALPPVSWMGMQLIRHRDSIHEATDKISNLHRRLDF